jgi:hypothetical protein
MFTVLEHRGDVVVGEGDFKMAMTRWGWPGQYHPYMSFTYTGPGGMGQHDSGHHFPAEVEVPMPVGDPEGSMETVNIDETARTLAMDVDESEHVEAFETLAWVYNYEVVSVPHLDYRYTRGYDNGANWDFADPEEEELMNITNAYSQPFKMGVADAASE